MTRRTYERAHLYRIREIDGKMTAKDKRRARAERDELHRRHNGIKITTDEMETATNASVRKSMVTNSSSRLESICAENTVKKFPCL